MTGSLSLSSAAPHSLQAGGVTNTQLPQVSILLLLHVHHLLF